MSALSIHPELRIKGLSVFFAAVAISPLLMPVSFAATDLADSPVPAANSQVPPNVMFTLDDSGSMQFEVIPESSNVYFSFPRPATVYGAGWGYGSSYSYVSRFDLANRYTRYFRTAKFNPLYYNPAKRYVPWTKSDGTLMPNATPTAAYHNPYVPGEGTRNLTANNTQTANWVDNSGSVTSASVTFYPATYFNWIPAGTLTGPTDGANVAASFTKIEIKAASAPFTGSAARTDCATPMSCTYAEEIQNFANWYTYYRSRILAVRAGTGRAFNEPFPIIPRVGFAAINYGPATVDSVASAGTVIRGVRSFVGADRANFYASLYGHVMPSAGTPLRTAIDDVGNYYKRTDNSGPWGPAPQLTCRASYNILTTDGYWNGGGAAAPASGNQDNTAGALILHPDGYSYQYAPGPPYADSWSDTLADAAMYYWKTDLRPDLDNRVPPRPAVPASGTNPGNPGDPAFWQHMGTFTVGLGVTGTLTGPATPTIWPSPGPVAATTPEKVDDLWHAAVNGRGQFFNAADPDEFATALASSLRSITAQGGTSAANAVANPNILTGDNVTFGSLYDPSSWSGDLIAYDVNLTTGAVTPSSMWGMQPPPNGARPHTAASKLNVRGLVASDTRLITTFNGGGVPFQWASLSASQQSLLNTVVLPAPDGQTVLQFLRGWRGREVGNSNCVGNVLAPCLYRQRANLLGDIVNAEAVVVGKALWHYEDPGYTTFRTYADTRAKTIYQGANDGMLHAFDAATGDERWAYIPSFVIKNLKNLTTAGGFVHKAFVDATPMLADIDFNFVTGAAPPAAPNWQSILVGGLGKGGTGYYALNVTDGTATTESAVASKVLWEFTDPDMGYTYGKPVAVKTRATGEGWVVLLPSGYNNVPAANGGPPGSTTGDGKGHLYILNARTGALIKKINIPDTGTVTNPSGFAHISVYVNNTDTDNTAEFAYGGDLNGHVWRVDLSGATVASWVVDSLPMAKLKDSLGGAQPITVIPELGEAKSRSSSRYRMVFIGTGKYYGISDIVTTQQQTMYGLKDAGMGSPTIDGRATLVGQTLTTSGVTRQASSNPVNLSTTNGWYLDLPVTRERANTDPSLQFGVLAFTSNIPSDDACSLYGGSSWVNYLDYRTGGALPGQGSTLLKSSDFIGSAMSTRVTMVVLNGTLKVTGARFGGPSGAGNTGATVPPPFVMNVPVGSTRGRVVWRELKNK